MDRPALSPEATELIENLIVSVHMLHTGGGTKSAMELALATATQKLCDYVAAVEAKAGGVPVLVGLH